MAYAYLRLCDGAGLFRGVRRRKRRSLRREATPEAIFKRHSARATICEIGSGNGE